MDMATGYRRFMTLLDHWANHGVPQMLGTTVSLVAISLGLSMFLSPGVFVDEDSFNTVFVFASPFAWGVVYIIAALAVMITVYTNHKSAQLPIFLLGAIFATQALLQVPDIANGSVPSGLFLFMGIGWICFITQLICGARKVHDEKAPFSQ